VTIALLLLLGAGGYYGWRWYQQTRQAENQLPAVVAHPTPPPPPTPAPQPAADATAANAAAPDAGAPELSAAPAQDGFLLQIRAKQDAWISYTADDSPAREVKMKPSDSTVEIRAHKRVKLVLGNAGGVEISHNGKPLPQLGPENKSRTVVFTPQGLER